MEAAKYWQSVLDINNRQKNRLALVVAENEITKSKIAIFGFSYKKNTSDTRSTPAVQVIQLLAKKGYKVCVHDPQVTKEGFEKEMEDQGYPIDADVENQLDI